MLDLFNLPTPQGCDIQTFYGSSKSPVNSFSWVKPRGVSNIYMMLIGGGGFGDGTSAGSSGAVTVWYGSAQNVPDNLIISPSSGLSGNTIVQTNTSSGYITILQANRGRSGGLGALVSAANTFAASGFYQSIAGANGSTGDPGASATTFLSGGGVSTVTANYGYTSTNQRGYFMFQPIIVGVGCSISFDNGGAHYGCGGGSSSSNSFGGPGFVLIASW